jgi:hypothetical protein
MDRRRQLIFPVGQPPFAALGGALAMGPTLLIADNRTKLMRRRAIPGAEFRRETIGKLRNRETERAGYG